MSEAKKKTVKRKSSPAPRPAEGQNDMEMSGTVGEILRRNREARKASFDDVSAAINIRPSQLRAIEEGNVSALPGMTYALGFVRSYATHLGLDGADIVQKFKTEHGGVNLASRNYNVPEPPSSGPQPNLMMIGIAVFCVALLLGFWAIFSGSDDAAKDVAEYVPPPPAATAAPVVPEAAPAAPVIAATPSVETPAPAAPAETAAVVPPPAAEAVGVTPVAAVAPEAVPAQTISETQPAVVPPEQPAAAPEVINVTRGKGRITLGASAPSWVEIRDASQQTIYKKVIHPDEKYIVPDQPGLVLMTSNAGGLDIYVDGQKVQSVGQPGEIVRGIDLKPDSLKKVRVRARSHR
jgi:cytoskeleton protein RodZ